LYTTTSISVLCVTPALENAKRSDNPTTIGHFRMRRALQRNAFSEKNDATISYLVVVRNKAKSISRCLESLVRAGIGQIVVVDGRSTDGTSEIIDRFPVLHLYDRGTGNVSNARNMGLKACTGDYVVIVDGDQWVPARFGRDLRQILADKTPDAVMMRELRSGTSEWARASQAEWTEVAALRHDWVYWPKVFRRSILRDIGGWDESLFIEDFDIWNRAKALNPKLLICSLAIYSDSSGVSPLTELRRGTEGISSLSKYVRRYPREWQRFLAIAPASWVYDLLIVMRVFLASKSIRTASLVFILRISRSIGRLIGVFYHPTRRLS